MVSGSYAPGDIYLFKGLSKQGFAVREKLTSSDGQPARAGLASSVAVADWDRDGKLDLVVGNIQGEVWFLPNVSNGAVSKDGMAKDRHLAFGAGQPVKAAGQPVKSDGDAGPLVVDWDGDGIADLIVGTNDGSVTFFKAGGTSGPPELAAGVTLIPALKDAWLEPLHAALDPKTGEVVLPPLARSLLRSKPAAFDWNGDGKLDLLVGDFVSAFGPEPELGAEQKQEKVELDRQHGEMTRRIADVIRAATERARKELGIKNEWESSDSQQKVFEKETEILREDARYRELSKESADIQEKLAALRAKYVTHGFVWVYLRK